MTLIETRDLSCGYGGQKIFSGINIKIDRGRRVRIEGPSGCGKTTLLKCLIGFVPPMSGQICIDGDILDADGVWTIRRKLAYVAQEPDLGSGDVLERVRQPFAYHANHHLNFDTEQLHYWLDYFYLPREILHKDVASLSGGEKQRLALIVAILLGRTTFLLDEPVSAMDAAGRRRFLGLFRERSDWTVLFISHDPVLSTLADMTLDMTHPGSEP